jgi:hypothetical protein
VAALQAPNVVGKAGRSETRASIRDSQVSIDWGRAPKSCWLHLHGGTPPFGHPTRLRAFLDRDLLAHEDVWAAAGTPDSVFRTSPSELQRSAGPRSRN